MTDLEKMMKAIKIQYDRPIPDLPKDWTGEEQWGYIHGWEDAMMHIWEAVLTYDAEEHIGRICWRCDYTIFGDEREYGSVM